MGEQKLGAIIRLDSELDPPLPVAPRKSRVPSLFSAVGICLKSLARQGRRLNKHLILSLQFPQFPITPLPPQCLWVTEDPLLPPSGHHQLAQTFWPAIKSPGKDQLLGGDSVARVLEPKSLASWACPREL
jgi:hypothetical protein